MISQYLNEYDSDFHVCTSAAVLGERLESVDGRTTVLDELLGEVDVLEVEGENPARPRLQLPDHTTDLITYTHPIKSTPF